MRLRSEPVISVPPTKKVIAELPDGWPVRAFSNEVVAGFREIEVVLSGTVFRGFSSADYLVAKAEVAPIPLVGGGVVPAVWMPRKAGTVTRCLQNANAHSLNEAGMPDRSGSTPDELRNDLHAFIAYLDPGNTARQKRYAPRSGLTFCNIYAHDYCDLAGDYLPRVWWVESAINAVAGGAPIEPLYGNTIREMRANDLFRWLDAYGSDFGWQRVPSAPLQSQAGTNSFNYSASNTDWWKKDRFADSAMWVHP